MADKDLADKLRPLGVIKVGGTPSEELLQKLEAVGLKIKAGQVEGIRIVSLGQSAQAHSGPHLEEYLSRMNAEQLKLVSRRYNPAANATRMDSVKQAVAQALARPALLEAMVARLDPLELELLQKVKQAGGRISGWDLIIHAALRGFSPVKYGVSSNWYKMHLAGSGGVTYLGTLLRDGLLLPTSFAAPWFDSYGYIGHRTSPEEADVLVDPRVLAVVPEMEKPPEFVPFKLGPAQAHPVAAHPARALLEWHETIKLVIEEEKVQVTREGRIARQNVARLSKKRPWLESLERNLQIMLTSGLIKPSPVAKDHYKPQLQACQNLLQVPLPMQYWTMVLGFLDSYEAPENDWQPNPEGVYSASVGRQALLEGLTLLPKHPVKLNEALEALWEGVLGYVGEIESGYYYHQRKQSLPDWYHKTLLGDFQALGLVGLAPLAAKGEYALAPGLGLEWFRQGQQLGALVKSRLAGPDLAPQGEAEVLELMGLDPQTHQPLERSLLLQPNFEILVYLDKLSPLALKALSCADCTRIDAQTASYSISRTSVYRALEGGLSAQQLLELLQSNSATPIPAAVATSLREWAERRERLSLQENTRLLEYHSAAERDAAVAQTGGKAIGERFLLVSPNTHLPKDILRHNYLGAPGRSLRFEADGRFHIKGASDLAARAVIASLAQPNPDGSYSFSQQAIRQSRFDSVRETFLARVEGGLPQQLEALLGIWEGKTASPSMARVNLFQHPNAAALAKHPALAKHLDNPISDTTYLVRPGQEKALEQALSDLGIRPSHELKSNLKAQAIQGSIMQTGLGTRKIRELAESALRDKRGLELQYHKEKVNYNRYGYPGSSKGKVISEKIEPQQISYEGSTPYLVGQTLEEGEPRRIRLGYVLGIAVL